MSFSEQADSSAEYTEKSNLYETLMRERDTVGSTRTYLRMLGIYYQSVPEHTANMLQLQRIATLVTNPTGEPSYPRELTDAFYWGEVLAYNTQERLVGDSWADASYRMINQSMVSALDELRDDELSQPDNLLQVAATIEGDLEVADGNSMPPAMDQLIIQWAQEITDNEEQQWQIILGFRYVIMEVVQKQSADANEGENSPSDVAERIRISNEFFELADRSEVDDVQGIETEPINDIRERIMESYADHVLAYGPYDESNEDEVDRLGVYLTQAMNRDFVDMEGIEAEDFLHVGGNAAFILYSEVEQTQNFYVLGENEFLEGSVEAVAVVDTPTQQTILYLQEHLTADELETETNPLGVVLVLKDPVIINNEGVHIQVGGNQVAGLILSNPDMHMSRYLL